MQKTLKDSVEIHGIKKYKFKFDVNEGEEIMIMPDDKRQEFEKEVEQFQLQLYTLLQEYPGIELDCTQFGKEKTFKIKAVTIDSKGAHGVNRQIATKNEEAGLFASNILDIR